MVLPVVSGVLLALAGSGLLLPASPLVALVPLALFLERTQGGGRRAFLGGMAAGGTAWGLLLHWLLPALLRVDPILALPLTLSVLLLLALLSGGAAWAVLHLRERGLPLWLALSLAWTGAEWLQGHAGPLAFPWMGLGTSLAPLPAWVGVAEWVGARGVTFWAATVNGMVATLLLPDSRPRYRVAPLVLLVPLVVLPPAWGHWRMATLETRSLGPVAVARPWIPLSLREDPRRELRAALEALEAIAPGIEPGVRLVVWPEAFLPGVLDRPGAPGVDPGPGLERLRLEAERLDAPQLVGGYVQGELPGGGQLLNGVVQVTGTGVQGPGAGKRRLVPGIEAGLPWPLDRLPGVRPGGLAAARGYPVTDAGGISVGVLICFESAFSQVSRRLRQGGAELLVAVTHDGWFAREPPFPGTGGVRQHPAHLVLRAVETRTGVARAATGGISLFVEPTGTVHGEVGGEGHRVSVGSVSTSDVTTLYLRTGDLVGPGSLVVLLLLLLPGAAGGRGRRDPHGSPGPGCGAA